MAAHRVSGFLLGFTLVVAVSWVVCRPSRVAPIQAQSESGGALRTVEIQFRADSPDTWKPLAAFFGQIDPSVSVIAVCPSDSDAAKLRARWRWKNPLQTVTMRCEITPWSKDRFLVGAGRLLCPHPTPTGMPARDNDARIAAHLAAFAPKQYQAVDTGLVFDAGDILCDSRRAVFGDELVHKNPGVKDLAKQLAAVTGLEAFELRRVPDHHIGMFAAPLEPGLTAVGDVDLGQKLGSGIPFAKPDFRPETMAPFRRAVEQFARSGDSLVQLPLVPIEPKVYVTYTNGVFEHRGGKRIVYMPWYGYPELDNAAKGAYQDAGWEVRPIPVRSVFRFRGTIGCLVNVLERDGSGRLGSSTPRGS